MHRWSGLPEGWLSLVLLLLMLTAVAFSIQWAQWEPSLQGALGMLLPATVVGLLFGFVLARLRRLPRALAHLLGATGGVAWIIFLSSTLQRVTLPGTGQVVEYLSPRLHGWLDLGTELLLRSIFLWRAFLRGLAGEDIVLFVVTLALVCWQIAFLSAWFTFRSHWPWAAVGVPGFVLLLNVFYAPQVPPLYFGFYLCMGMTFLIYYSWRRKLLQWQQERVRCPPELSGGVFWAGLALSLVLVVGTSLLPMTTGGAEQGSFWDRVFEPWRQVRSTWQRLFSNVQGTMGADRLGEYASSFGLAGARTSPEGIALLVRTERSDYLRGIAFDQYDGHGWSDTAGQSTLWTMGSGFLRLPGRGRMRVLQEIIPEYQGGNMVFAAGEPISLSLAAVAQLGAPQEQTGLADIVAVRTLSTPPRGSGYRVLALLSVADKTSLRQAGQDYPLAIQQRYLQLPEALPAQVRELADQILLQRLDPSSLLVQSSSEPAPAIRLLGIEIDQGDQLIHLTTATAPELEIVLRIRKGQVIGVSPPGSLVRSGLVTPYDAAEAVQDYLRSNYSYRDDIAPPPADQDAVAYFLLESKAGYCDYFASAMVVLLRAEGIPARVVRGYTGGAYDKETAAYVVLASMAHAWPEVYFPLYGWQRFEPTASSYTTLPMRPELPPVEESAGTSTDRTTTPTARRRDNPQLDDEGLPLDDLGTAPTQAAPSGPPWIALGAGGLVGLTVLGSGAFLNWRIGRGLRRLSPTAALYERMCRWAGVVRLPLPEHLTPSEAAQLLGAALPAQQSGFARLAALYTRERFRGRPLHGAELSEARRIWNEIRGPLWQYPWQRLWALLRARVERVSSWAMRAGFVARE